MKCRQDGAELRFLPVASGFPGFEPGWCLPLLLPEPCPQSFSHKDRQQGAEPAPPPKSAFCHLSPVRVSERSTTDRVHMAVLSLLSSLLGGVFALNSSRWDSLFPTNLLSHLWEQWKLLSLQDLLAARSAI